MIDISIVVHIYPSAHSQGRSIFIIRCYSVHHKFLDCTPIAHDEAIESPLPAQNIAEQIPVRRHWHPIERIEGDHYAWRPGFDRGFVRREINPTKRPIRHVHFVVITTTH